MTTFIIEQTHPIDGTAARKLAHAAGHVPNPSVYSDLADGIEEFVTGIETLFAPGTPDLVADLEATRLTVGGQTVWSVFYGDGVGDSSGWTANASWFEQEVPGLMAALGVKLNVSVSTWGEPAHTIP